MRHNFDVPSEKIDSTPSSSGYYAVAIDFRQYVSKLYKMIVFRSYSKKFKTKFIVNIDNEFITNRPYITNVIQYSNDFIDFIAKTQMKHFPIQTKQMSEKKIYITADKIRCFAKH